MGYIKFFLLFFTLTILQGCNIADNNSASPPPPVEKDNDLTNQENTRQGEVKLIYLISQALI